MSLLAVIVVVGLASVLLFNFIAKKVQLVRVVGKLKGPSALPIIGNAHQLLRSQYSLFKFMEECCRKYPGMYRLWVGMEPWIVIHHAEIAQTILSCNTNIKKGYNYKFVESFVQQGLLTSSGSKWHERRKLLTPAFHLGILERFCLPIWKNSLNLTMTLDKFKNGEIFDVLPFIKLVSLDIICETAMGKKIDALNQCNVDYVQAIHKMSEIILLRTFNPALQYQIIFQLTKLSKLERDVIKALNEFCLMVIKERKLDLKNTPQNLENQDFHSVKKYRTKLALLDLLLEDSYELSDNDILEEVNTFVFAGHDTTASGISWILYILGHHPEAQERILKELQTEIPNFGSSGITYKELGKLDFLERCIKETQRMFPSVPLISRSISKAINTDAGLIPQDTTVILDIFNLHRDIKHFPNPKKFNPDRFLKSEVRHPFAYIPFSAGPRNCIGQKFAMMEMKIVVASIVKNYYIKSIKNINELKLRVNVTLENKEGIEISLQKREF